MNDARNVRRPLKRDYTTIRRTVTALVHETSALHTAEYERLVSRLEGLAPARR
jgi:hypothetical protein